MRAVAVMAALALASPALAEPRPMPRPDTAAPDAAPEPAPSATAPAKTPAPPPKPEGRIAPPVAVDVAPEVAPEPAPETAPAPLVEGRPADIPQNDIPQIEPAPEIVAPPHVTAPPRVVVPLSPLNPSGILTAPPPVGLTPMPLPEGEGCLAALDALGVTYTRPGPITDPTPGCGIPDPVQVDQIAPGVTLHGTAPMRCEAALALAQWTRGFVQPAAAIWAAQGHGALTGYRTGSTYACRVRNGDGSGKVSEHAIGNAIDIAAFTFEGSPDLTVTPRASGNDMETAFQRTVSGAACLFFTTVLGPGSDGAHEDHLHLDIKPRTGGYRICQ